MEQLKWITVVLLLIGLLNSGHSRPSDPYDSYDYGKENDYDEELQGDDHYEYKDDSVDEDQNAVETNDAVVDSPPYFEIYDDHREAKIGEDVTLFCDVKNLGPTNVVMWYNGTNIITNNKYSISPRVTTVESNAIVISNLQKWDANDYYCEVLPSKIRFHVKLDVIATRLAVFSHDRDVTNRSITFRQNERVEFECRAFDIPGNAIIKWAVNGKRVEPPHVTSVTDGKVIIDHVDAHHAGTYQCLGDDKSQRPLHASVTINVQYAPKVSTHRHHVNTEENDTAELYCNYKAEPIAYPQWKKDGAYIPATDFENYKFEDIVHDGRNRTILYVRNVQVDDLGVYVCEVQNSIGVSHAKVTLQFEPETPQFEKIDISDNKITLQWLVRSKQPLVDVMLNYKINGSHNWMTESVLKSDKHHHHEHTGIWKLHHELELSPGTWYAQVKVKNTAGWSKFSPQKDFRVEEAISENSVPQDIQYATVLTGNKGNGAESRLKMVPSALVACLLTSLVPFLRNL